MIIKELETEEFGFVRAKVISSAWRCGYLSFDLEDMDDRKNNYSLFYGRWHRLDEKKLEEIINTEINKIKSLMFLDNEINGLIYSYEFKKEW